MFTLLLKFSDSTTKILASKKRGNIILYMCSNKHIIASKHINIHSQITCLFAHMRNKLLLCDGKLVGLWVPQSQSTPTTVRKKFSSIIPVMLAT